MINRLTRDEAVALANEYVDLAGAMKRGMTRKLTRRHKVTHTRMAEIVAALSQHGHGDLIHSIIAHDQTEIRR